MEKISGLTRGAMASKNLGKAAGAAFICHMANKALKDIFDKEFLKEIKIVSFRDGSLYFSAENTHCIQEIKMKEGDIMKKCNEILKKELIEKIRFRADKKERY